MNHQAIKVTVRRSGEADQTLLVHKPTLTIGRDPSECELVLGDRGVSSRHARLRVHDGGIEAEDLGSLNGTFLNEVRMSGAQRLGDSDVLYIHAYRIQARLAQVDAQPSEAAVRAEITETVSATGHDLSQEPPEFLLPVGFVVDEPPSPRATRPDRPAPSGRRPLRRRSRDAIFRELRAEFTPRASRSAVARAVADAVVTLEDEAPGDRAALIAKITAELCGLGPYDEWAAGRGASAVCLRAGPDEAFSCGAAIADVVGRLIDDVPSARRPIVERWLADGTVVTAVHSSCTPGGGRLLLRPFVEGSCSLERLVAAGAVPEAVAASLAGLVQAGASALICGPTDTWTFSLLAALVERVAVVDPVVLVRGALEPYRPPAGVCLVDPVVAAAAPLHRVALSLAPRLAIHRVDAIERGGSLLTKSLRRGGLIASIDADSAAHGIERVARMAGGRSGAPRFDLILVEPPNPSEALEVLWTHEGSLARLTTTERGRSACEPLAIEALRDRVLARGRALDRGQEGDDA
ncbi:MAG: FHA domain-containing protein [Myxococcales bacterium]|nr:FHA domain-containing protein [Myxococcales bacterium]